MNKESSIPVFLSSNENFAPLVAVTIASICSNTKSFVNFYVLDSDINELSKRKIEKLKEKFTNFSIEYLKVDLDKYFKNYVQTAAVSRDTYSKYLIPLLKPELDKVIYSDVDVIVLGDIKEMYDIDLKDTYVGACPRYFYYDDEHLKNDLNMTDEELKGYAFQCGNLLINCKKWREDNVLEKFLKVHQDYGNKVYGVDQDVLFKVFKNNFTPIHSKFCSTTLICDGFYGNKSINGMPEVKIRLRGNDKKEDVLKELEEAITNPVIRHFETKNKPWSTELSIYSGKRMTFFKEFWYYAKMTEFFDDIMLRFVISGNNSITNIIISENKKTANIITNRLDFETKNIKLFNLIPLIKIYKKNNKIKYKLFGFIPFLTIKLK